jgi:hypothetical protein
MWGCGFIAGGFVWWAGWGGLAKESSGWGDWDGDVAGGRSQAGNEQPSPALRDTSSALRDTSPRSQVTLSKTMWQTT